MNTCPRLIITHEGLVYQGPMGEEIFLWENLTALTNDSFTLLGVLKISSPFPIENPNAYTPPLGDPILPAISTPSTLSLSSLKRKHLLDTLETLHASIKTIIERLHHIAPDLTPHLLIPLAQLRSKLGAE